MADGFPVKTDKHTQIDEKLRPTENHWQEAWLREQELVAHPSRIDLCESKMICITMVDEKLRLSCDDDTDTATSWNELESMSH